MSDATPVELRTSSDLEPSSSTYQAPAQIVRIVSVAFALGALVSSLGVARWVFAIVRHRSQGLDPSDEAFYLLSAGNPDASVARLSNFGYYLRLMRLASGGSLGGLRLAGLIVLLASTAAAAWGATRWLPLEMRSRYRRLYFLAAWGCVSSVALTHYALWIVTPNYNLLALAMALVVFGGLLSALPGAILRPQPVPWWPPIGGFVLAGAASVILADVKATSGVGVVLLCATILFCVVGPRRALGAAWSIAGGMIIGVLGDFVVVGSPITSVTKIRRVIHSASLDGAHSSSAVLDREFLTHTVLGWLGWFSAATFAIVVAWRWIRTPSFRAGIMAMSALAMAFVLWDEHARGGSSALEFNGWWLLRTSAWTLLFLTALAPSRTRVLCVGPLVALGAVVVAFGSNNGFIHQTALTAGLLAMAVVAQATIVAFSGNGALWRALPALVFFVSASWASFGAVAGATSDPYRLDSPIEANTQSILLGDFGPVDVTPHMAEYITGLQALAPLVPADARDCLVDLSGGTPVSAIALGARSATMEWLAGGYPGSDRALAYMLTFAPCIKGRVLLIDAPDGARRITLPTVLQGRDYRLLGTVHFDGYLDEVQIVAILGPATHG